MKRSNSSTSIQTVLRQAAPAFDWRFESNRLGLYKDAGSLIANSTSPNDDTTGFHHYVVTKDGASVKVYVDGADVTSAVTDQTLGNHNTDSRLFMGTKDGTAQLLAGALDEVAVYEQVLTPAQVADH